MQRCVCTPDIPTLTQTTKKTKKESSIKCCVCFAKEREQKSPTFIRVESYFTIFITFSLTQAHIEHTHTQKLYIF